VNVRREAREVVVFCTGAEPAFGHPSSAATLAARGRLISAAVGFWHQVEPASCDRLRLFGDTGGEIAGTARLVREAGARFAGLFHNLLYGASAKSREVAARLLCGEGNAERFAADAGRTAREYGYDEVNVDLEHVPPSLRGALSDFVELFARTLHGLGVAVSASVPAKTWDDPEHGWSGAFDYARIGAAVDRVYLMTYDEHGYSSGPGPIASNGWVEAVVKYAVTAIPAEKVYLGLAGYGFDWAEGKKPRYLSHAQAVAKAEERGVSIRRDPASGAPTYRYRENGEEHEVWFEDAVSSKGKLALVESYGLAGIALWRAGLEDPGLWEEVDRAFDVRKPAPRAAF